MYYVKHTDPTEAAKVVTEAEAEEVRQADPGLLIGPYPTVDEARREAEVIGVYLV